MCSKKKNLFHELVKSLKFASEKCDLRKAEGLKLLFKNSTVIKKILQSLRCGGHHQK